MGIEHLFQTELGARMDFIRDDIVGMLPITENGERLALVERIMAVLDKYAGSDMYVLTILFHAAQQGKLKMYCSKLEEYEREDWESRLWVHPSVRKIAKRELPAKREGFHRIMIECYNELGIPLNCYEDEGGQVIA